MTTNDTYAIPEWAPAKPAFMSFCEANPGLGFKGSQNSYFWFCRVYVPTLLKAGVMRRTAAKVLLVHVPTFAQTAFDLISRADVEEVA